MSAVAGTVTTVNVTAEHIAKGEQCEAGDCPIAHALNEAGIMPADGFAVVSCDRVYLNWGSRARLRAWLPDEARSFVDDFDLKGGEQAEPFTFQLTWEAA